VLRVHRHDPGLNLRDSPGDMGRLIDTCTPDAADQDFLHKERREQRSRQQECPGRAKLPLHQGRS
jgi:hypothetical protein